MHINCILAMKAGTHFAFLAFELTVQGWPIVAQMPVPGQLRPSDPSRTINSWLSHTFAPALNAGLVQLLSLSPLSWSKAAVSLQNALNRPR